VGNVVDVAPEQVAIGARVRAVFEEVEAERERLLIPKWFLLK
jgi:uncharacterized OB-fold protein